MHTELESGAWIEHRPIDDLKTKDKDAVGSAVKMHLPLTEDGEIDRSQGLLFGGAMQVAARDATWGRLITGWSYDLPVPECDRFGTVINGDSIGELPIDDSNEIEELFAPAVAKLRKRPDPKRGDYIQLKWVLQGKSDRLPEGLTREALTDILCLIRYGLHPTGEGGRGGLPVEVGTWLMPVQAAIDRIQQEAHEEASRR